MPIPDELKRYQVIRFKEVIAQTPFSTRGKLYTEIRNGRFPRPLKIGKRAIGWLAEEVNEWVQSRIDESNDRRS